MALGEGGATEPEMRVKALRAPRELVRINLARAFQKQERYYNLRRRPWHPRVGDTVWKKEHSLSNKAEAFSAKLAPRFQGPFTIKRIKSPVIVNLRDEHGKMYTHIHIQDLKLTKTGDEPA